MTAVAVGAPSSGSSWIVLLFWVVVADPCPSLFVARGLGAHAPLTLRALLFVAFHADGDPVRPVFDRSSRGRDPYGRGDAREPLPRTGPSADDGGGVGCSCGGCRTREGTARRTVPSSCLSAQTQPLDERAVTADVGLRQVVQQAAAPPDQQEQAAPAVVVVLVLLEVLGEIADPAGQHRDLHLGRAGVVLDRRVVGHDLLLESAFERHRTASLARSRVVPGLVHGGSLHTRRLPDVRNNRTSVTAGLRPAPRPGAVPTCVEPLPPLLG